jgi:hypothetical protein
VSLRRPVWRHRLDDRFATSIDEVDLESIRAALVQRYGEVTYSDGDVHHYLGQRFNFSQKGECKISMMDYICDAFDVYKVSGYRVTPATDGLFAVDSESRPLGVELAAQFRSRVAKLLYVALRCRPDILLTESFLTSRVSSPTEKDWS